MKYITASVLLLMLLLAPAIASGATLTMLDNTDRCIYKPELDLDFCYTVYELCDSKTPIDTGKVQFVFRDDKTPLAQVSPTWDNLIKLVNYKDSVKDAGCKIINITGYKNRFDNIDNVPCYDSYCWTEFVWWNTSFPNKVALNASCTSCSAYPPKPLMT